MKTLIRYFSAALFICLTIINAVMIWADINISIADLEEIKNPPLGTLDGAPTPILDAGAQVYRIVFLVIFAVIVLIVAGEILLNLFFYVRAVKDGKFGFFLAFSISGLAEVIINSLVILFMASIGVNIMGGEEYAYALEKVVFVYIIVAVLLIINIVLTNSYAKEENP